MAYNEILEFVQRASSRTWSPPANSTRPAPRRADCCVRSGAKLMRVFVDGREGGRIDPLDRGLHYGDGLFQTMAVLDGRPPASGTGISTPLRRRAERWACRRRTTTS